MQKNFLISHKFEKKFIEIIKREKLFSNNDFLIVGFSGGADSVALLYLLNKIYKKTNEILAIHINHNLRKNSLIDEKFAISFAKKNDIDFEVFDVDIKKLAIEKKNSIEKIAREFRYEVFYSTANKHKSENSNIKIFTAHHKNDQVETILLRLIRGTGIQGLSGIKCKSVFRKEFELVRPMLNFSKDEILEYLAAEKIEFVSDESNFENEYKRNKIRNKLIPYLEKNYNENIKEAIYRYAKSANIANDFLDKETAKIFERLVHGKNTNKKVEVHYQKIKNLDREILIRFIVKVFNTIGLKQDIEMTHIEAGLKMIEKKEGNKVIQFPHGYEMSLANKKICFYK
ncbi:MAG: tRNA lysidine(34) synthetase TilS [Clostridiales Family XIII bacterium]|jgi:tRNA(Ile)-lysidine synthase|nr:tRNA lysidine(34) synthetase TilS [Clostridiales Family XIII bacterium]